MLIAFLLSLLLTLSPHTEVAPATLEAAPDPEMAAFLPVRQQVDSCLRAGEYQAAWDLLQEAASRFQEAGWLRPLSACRHRQGVVAERMGKDNMAANYFREALQLVRETGNLPLEKLLCQDLAALLKKTDVKKAFGYLETSLAISDTLFRQETARMTAVFSEQGAAAERARLQEQEQERKRLKAWEWTAGVLAATVLVLLFRRPRKRKEETT